MSKLLVDEYPLIVLPTLARVLGLNEAIFLQQLNYWLAGSQHDYDGRKWVYNTFEEWQKQLPFFTVITIKRIVKSLRDQGIIITTSQHNKLPMDRTLWYSIDRERLDHIILHSPLYQNDTMPVSDGLPSYQNDTTIVSNRYDAKYQDDTSNTRDYYTETTTDIKQGERESIPVNAPTAPPPPALPTVTVDEIRPDPNDPRIHTDEPTNYTKSAAYYDNKPVRKPGKAQGVDPRKLGEDGLIPPGQGTTPLEVWREYYADCPTAAQMRELTAAVDSPAKLAAWRALVKEKSLAGWRSFGNVFDVYRNGHRKEPSNGTHSTNGGSPDTPSAGSEPIKRYRLSDLKADPNAPF